MNAIVLIAVVLLFITIAFLIFGRFRAALVAFIPCAAIVGFFWRFLEGFGG